MPAGVSVTTSSRKCEEPGNFFAMAESKKDRNLSARLAGASVLQSGPVSPCPKEKICTVYFAQFLSHLLPFLS
jgi:hypothetical protein